MHTRLFTLMLLAGLAAVPPGTSASAQQPDTAGAGAAPAAAPAAPAQPQQPWATSCSATSRKAPLSCSMEQQVIVRETGRPIARIAIQVAGTEPRTPALLIHIPLNVAISAGVTMQIDDDEAKRFYVQTCDANGCYAGSPLPSETIASLKRGKVLKVGFQGNDKQPVNIPFSLADFTATFEGIE